jgi:hypothetical protein
MGTYGDYQTVRRLDSTPTGTEVWVARRVGDDPDAAPRYAVKVFSPPDYISGDEQSERLLFLEAATILQSLGQGSPRFARVHDSGLGEDEDEFGRARAVAWYATDLMVTPDNRRPGSLGVLRDTLGKRQLSDAEIANVLLGVVEALQVMRALEGRGHGRLVASNVLLSTLQQVGQADVLVSDPRPTKKLPPNVDRHDERGLARLVYEMVFKRECSDDALERLPRQEQWQADGRTGQFWYQLCLEYGELDRNERRPLETLASQLGDLLGGDAPATPAAPSAPAQPRTQPTSSKTRPIGPATSPPSGPSTNPLTTPADAVSSEAKTVPLRRSSSGRRLIEPSAPGTPYTPNAPGGPEAPVAPDAPAAPGAVDATAQVSTPVGGSVAPEGKSARQPEASTGDAPAPSAAPEVSAPTAPGARTRPIRPVADAEGDEDTDGGVWSERTRPTGARRGADTRAGDALRAGVGTPVRKAAVKPKSSLGLWIGVAAGVLVLAGVGVGVAILMRGGEQRPAPVVVDPTAPPSKQDFQVDGVLRQVYRMSVAEGGDALTERKAFELSELKGVLELVTREVREAGDKLRDERADDDQIKRLNDARTRVVEEIGKWPALGVLRERAVPPAGAGEALDAKHWADAAALVRDWDDLLDTKIVKGVKRREGDTGTIDGDQEGVNRLRLVRLVERTRAIDAAGGGGAGGAGAMALDEWQKLGERAAEAQSTLKKAVGDAPGAATGVLTWLKASSSKRPARDAKVADDVSAIEGLVKSINTLEPTLRGELLKEPAISAAFAPDKDLAAQISALVGGFSAPGEPDPRGAALAAVEDRIKAMSDELKSAQTEFDRMNDDARGRCKADVTTRQSAIETAITALTQQVADVRGRPWVGKYAGEIKSALAQLQEATASSGPKAAIATGLAELKATIAGCDLGGQIAALKQRAQALAQFWGDATSNELVGRAESAEKKLPSDRPGAQTAVNEASARVAELEELAKSLATDFEKVDASIARGVLLDEPVASPGETLGAVVARVDAARAKVPAQSAAVLAKLDAAGGYAKTLSDAGATSLAKDWVPQSLGAARAWGRARTNANTPLTIDDATAQVGVFSAWRDLASKAPQDVRATRASEVAGAALAIWTRVATGVAKGEADAAIAQWPSVENLAASLSIDEASRPAWTRANARRAKFVAELDRVDKLSGKERESQLADVVKAFGADSELLAKSVEGTSGGEWASGVRELGLGAASALAQAGGKPASRPEEEGPAKGAVAWAYDPVASQALEGETGVKGARVYGTGATQLAFIPLTVRDPAAGEKTVFVSREEVSLGVFRAGLDKVGGAPALQELVSAINPAQLFPLGLRVWVPSRAGDAWQRIVVSAGTDGAVARGWLYLGGPAVPLRGSILGTGLEPREGPTERSPMQSVSIGAARKVAGALGCRVPSTDEFAGALQAERSAGTGVDDASTWRLRGSGWSSQIAHLTSLLTQPAARNLNGSPDMIPWPGRGGHTFEEAKAAQDTGTWPGGAAGLFLSPVNEARGKLFRHLIGNVAEFADRGAQWEIVGGSIMSAPAGSVAALAEPARLSREAREECDAHGFADVGFRLAFDSGGVAPDPVRLVRDALRGKPLAQPTGASLSAPVRPGAR